MMKELRATNVVSLERYKENAELRKSQKDYGLYLKGLTRPQLESEVNYLLVEYNGDQNGKDYLLKGQLLLQEMSHRTEGEWKASIGQMGLELSKKIETFL